MTTSPIGSAPQTAMHGIAWMIGATFLYAFTFVTIRELSRDFSVVELSFLRAAMGTLKFEDLTYEALGTKEVLARGIWRLTREKDNPWGRFVLVMRPLADGSAWRVVLDYTTVEGK